MWLQGLLQTLRTQGANIRDGEPKGAFEPGQRTSKENAKWLTLHTARTVDKNQMPMWPDLTLCHRAKSKPDAGQQGRKPNRRWKNLDNIKHKGTMELKITYALYDMLVSWSSLVQQTSTKNHINNRFWQQALFNVYCLWYSTNDKTKQILQLVL